MKKTLPSIRVDERDIENINQSLEKFNKNSILEMSLSGFRRLAYQMLSNLILSGEEIPISFKSSNSS